MKRLSFLLLASLSLPACKKEAAPPPPSRIKKVVRVNVMDTKFIQLDDGSRYGMGENLYNRLVTRLQNSNRFVVVVNEPWGMAKSNHRSLVANKITKEEPAPFDPSDRLHFDFPPVAAADFRASVEGLTFTHGSRGVKRFAGYNNHFRTPWNNGEFEKINEFPPRSLDFFQGWFGTNFDPIGSDTNNTISGVDAGEEGEMNLLIASMHYRRDRFVATAQVNTELKLLEENTLRESIIHATGKGFLFALGIDYMGISAEFGLKRNDALKQTFDYEVDGISKEIQAQLETIPFRTRVEHYGEQGIILNAGKREGVIVGDIFLHRAGEEMTVLKVVEVFQIGSIVQVESGATNTLNVGDIVTLDEKTTTTKTRSRRGIASVTAPVRSLSLSQKDLVDNRKSLVAQETRSRETKNISLDPPEFSLVDDDANYGLGMKSTIMLPWLLARWPQYDQDIKTFQAPARNNLENKASTQWNLAMVRTLEAWKNSGTKGSGVKVAVIDTGVDYNHQNLSTAISRDYAGWDFISYDARPFDDNSHGTAIAGIIAGQGIGSEPVGIAPDAQIFSYKVFDPYGATTSAAIYGAFQRAIQDGARIIVAAWSTRKNSEAIARALALADASGVLVIAAAGDRGTDLNNDPHFPAAYSNHNNVISVAALNKSGALSAAYGRYSNFGIGVVDIAAPGESLDVLAPRSEYLVRGGSDMAAAHVAGAAALIAAMNPSAKAPELKTLLLKGCAVSEALISSVTNGCVLDIANALQ